MPTELLSTERASVIATICFFLDFFLIIVLLTSLETVFLAQLFRNLQHKIDARWAVLIILYYIRFPKISRGKLHEKKPARKFRLIDGQIGPKMAKLHEKKYDFRSF